MKSFSVALAAAYATRQTALATAVKITRADGDVFAYTSNDVSDSVGGVTYLSSPGLKTSNIVTTANLAVDNLEANVLNDGTVFTTKDIMNGVWRNARFEIFRYMTNDLTGGTDPLMSGTLGQSRIKRNLLVAELRSLFQYLQQGIGSNTSKLCRARLGDARCRKVLAVSPSTFIMSGSITSVTSNQVFRDSTRTEALAWFDDGEIEFITGNNEGVTVKVKTYASNGTFTLALPLFGTVAISDTYTATAGCRKRIEEDCYTKFNNVANFYGEPHIVGINSLTQSPVVDA